MNGRKFINKIMIGLWLTCIMTIVHAGKPLWTLTPLTQTTITVMANDTATVSYQVTNQSRKTHTLVLKAFPGLTQLTTAGNCPTPFILGYQQSCILNLSINGSALNGNVNVGPIVCDQGNLDQCYQPSAANSLHITKGPAVDYTVGGSVGGLLGTLVLENNGGDTLTLTADGTFTFSNPLPPGSDYLVTVQSQPATQTCTLTQGSGTITNTNITNVAVNCSNNTRTIGGTVSTLSGTVVLQNNGSDNLAISSSGPFVFPIPVAQGAPYDVQIVTQPSTQTCNVVNGSGVAGASNITSVQVICSTNAYTVGGTVSNLSGTVVLQNNGGDSLTVNGNGPFVFPAPVAQGAPYNVAVLTQPTGQTCSVTNGSGTMGGANVTNVGVNCFTNTTTLSISTSQLALSVTGLAEYGVSGTPSSGVARVITITNTGSSAAVNLAVTTPAWPTGTSSSTNCSTTLAASSSCTITITPGATATSNATLPCSNGTAPIPGVVQVSASNATTVSSNVVVLGYGCVYQGGYVYAFDDTTPNTGSVGGKVVTTSDQATAFTSTAVVWSSNGVPSVSSPTASTNAAVTSNDVIPGIGHFSTSGTGSPTYTAFNSFFSNNYTNTNPFTSASFALCNGKLDGACNTGNLLTFYNQFITNNTQADGGSPPFTASTASTNITYYAAGLCKQTIATYSDWYLPAICEMGYYTSSTICGNSGVPLLQNIQSSLIDGAGFTSPLGNYWSSTEYSFDPQVGAYFQYFASGGTSLQNSISKTARYGVRCSRALTI